jgi:hypothetical protein
MTALRNMSPTGTVHLFERADGASGAFSISACVPAALPPAALPVANWVGNLFAALPFARQYPDQLPQPAAATKVLDAVSTFTMLIISHSC